MGEHDLLHALRRKVAQASTDYAVCLQLAVGQDVRRPASRTSQDVHEQPLGPTEGVPALDGSVSLIVHLPSTEEPKTRSESQVGKSYAGQLQSSLVIQSSS